MSHYFLRLTHWDVHILVFVLVLTVQGCGGSSDSGASSTGGPRTVSSQGGTVTLPGVASVTFPAGAFATSQTVQIAATSSPETNEDFVRSGDIFSAGPRFSSEVRINTGNIASQTDFTVDINVPDSFLASLPQGSEIQLFAQIFQQGGEETLDSFELFPSVYDQAKKILRTILPREAFTNGRTSDGTYEAIVVLSTTPTLPSSSTTNSTASLTDMGPPVSPERLVTAGHVMSPVVQAVNSPSQSTCQGATLGSPLQRSLQITSNFNGKTHFGTDYDTADSGDNVIAAVDGKIFKIGFDERPLKTPDPRSGKTVKGWGRYIIVEHADGSKTLYAHLKKDSTDQLKEGQTVAKGDVIAEADNSGGSSGSHLHFEYAPNGKIFQKGSKIDPAPCVDALVQGSISVGDNGSAADDAFQVILNGIVLGQTSIGASNTFSASNLRSGTATLRIICVIAPDNIGTLGVTLSQGLQFQDGSTARSEVLPEGGSVSYIIIIP